MCVCVDTAGLYFIVQVSCSCSLFSLSICRFFSTKVVQQILPRCSDFQVFYFDSLFLISLITSAKSMLLCISSFTVDV